MTLQTSIFPSETETQIGSRKCREMEKRDPEKIEHYRKAARHFCHTNKGLSVHRVPHCVCADDIRRELDIEPIKRARSYWIRKSNNIMGSVFKKGFVKLGPMVSKTAGSHGNEIKAWTLPEYYDIAKPVFNQEYLK